MTTKKLNEEVSKESEIDVAKPAKTRKELAKEKLHQLMKEESRLVRGIFQCFEAPGSTVPVSVFKYPGPDQGGIPPFQMTMTDGETYEIPLYVARFLNGVDITSGALGDANKRNINIGTCSYPIHGFAWKESAAPSSGQDGRGIPIPLVSVFKRIKRFGFQSLEFAGEWA